MEWRGEGELVLLTRLSLTPSGVRPFGVSLLIAGYDEDVPYLFQCDPSVSH